MLGAPTSVEVILQEGKNPYTFPKKSVTRFEFPARGSMPAVKLFWHDASNGPAYRPEGHPENEPLIAGAGAFGSDGTTFTGGGPVRAEPPPAGAAPTPSQRPAGGGRQGSRGPNPASNGVVFIGDKGILTTDTYGANVRLLPEARHKEYKLPPKLLTRSPGHHRDFIRAAKGGDRSCSDFSVAGPFTEWIVLGSVALRFEGKLEWDSVKMRFTNNSEANQYIKPKFRKGWQIA
jgi:hypothetical protein